jgi:excisionase family DNA binding protein
MGSNQETVEKKNVSANEAASYLGCSYPHLIHLIKKSKIKAQKIRNQWFVDLDDLERAKSTHLVTPRPRPGSPQKTKREPEVVYSSRAAKSETGSGQKGLFPSFGRDQFFDQVDSIELRLSIPRRKNELINSAMLAGTNKTLKQHFESKAEEMFVSLANRVKNSTF